MNHEDNSDHTRTHVALTRGTMVQHYRIVKKIGAGGMGEVYLAEDTKLKRQVALKFLPTHLIANQEIHARFVREAQTVAKLNHPNIVSIHDVSEFNGRPFYVMELVEGESLHHFTQEKQLSMDTVVEYAIQICQGLGEAHRAGIVHRDIKAANIAVDKQGRIRLLDFGLAAVEGEDKITKTGSTLGTVAYMSPEQVSGREIDNRSDLFSLGVVLYELIAGRTPFKRDNEGATLKAIMEDNPEPLTRYKADVPDKLQAIIFELLEKDKEIRYQSAEGVIAHLKRLTYDSRPTGYTQTAIEKPKKTGLLIGIIAAVLICIAGITYFMNRSDTSQTETVDKVPMIAVLPFENLGSPDDEYFADGMTDEIISRLAGIEGLGVISHTSSMKYKSTEKSLREIGSELGVEFILDGTVRWSKVGDQAEVRISPKLVRVADDRHLWADNYQRSLMEVFAVQADIASKIVEQMGLTLLEKDEKELRTRPTENAKAYELYLRGLNGIRRRGDFGFQEMSQVKDYFDQAVALDPNFAQAHAARSTHYSSMAFWTKSEEYRTIALESAIRSLELNPTLSRGHLAMGVYYNLVETDYGRALEEFYIAKSELHNDPDLLAAIGLVLMRQGKFDEANESYLEATELDPLNPVHHWNYSICLKFTRRYVDAEEAIDRAIALEPEREHNHITKIHLYNSLYGEWDKIEPLVVNALQQVDTLELAIQVPWIFDLMPQLPWKRLFNEFRETRSAKILPEVFYGMLAGTANYLGDFETAGIYADSARIELEKKLELEPDDGHRASALGMVYSYLGDCEKAIELGQRGKEILSVEECHW